MVSVAAPVCMAREIRIGGLGPLSAPGVVWAGLDLQDGMTLAVQHLNGAGGVLGRSVTLLFEDTCGHTGVGIAAIEKLSEQVDALAGEYHSFVANAFLDRVQRSGVPFVCASCTLDAITERRVSCVFRLAPPQSYGWRIYADFLAGEGFQHVIALQEENQYWNAGSRIIELRLQELGVRFTRFSVPPGSADPRRWIEQLEALARKKPGPDILLLLISDADPLRSMIEECRSHGFVPPKCFLGDPAGRAGFPEWWRTVRTKSTPIPFLSYSRWDGLTPVGKRAVREFEKQFGRQPTFVALEGYDSVLSLGRAFVEAGSTDPARDCDALRRIQCEATRGTIRFSTEPAGVVHQQWKWPPVCVAVYRQVPRQFGEADILWDSQLGAVSGTGSLRVSCNNPSAGD
jgi:ABC-type branched-subunit amino acid transport system substrate-binding protein